MPEITNTLGRRDPVVQGAPESLTGLRGRASLTANLSEVLAEAYLRAKRVVVMLLDLDDFFIVNDSYGHSVGDELLVAIANRMLDTVGLRGVVGHFGGDVFTVVSTDLSDERSTNQLAEELVAAVAQPVVLSECEVFVTASVGISVSEGCDDTADFLLRNADVALHKAKEGGTGATVLFDAGRHERAFPHLRTRNELQTALEREQFRLYFQPVVNLQTGQAASYEALVRWQHPNRGLLLPQEFITHAEQTGVIEELGMWVLEEACRKMVLWGTPESGDSNWSMSVNLSPRQLARRSFPATVTSILQRTGMRGDRLSLEITETSLMHDAEAATSVLAELRGLGVRIAVDDFGTGYSCLAYLKALPVDTLKIDRYFVEGIGSDAASTAICAAIVRLADALQLETVAEGVETARQLAGLRTLGCRLGQGFLFGEARPPEAYDQAYDWRSASFPLAEADRWVETCEIVL